MFQRCDSCRRIFQNATARTSLYFLSIPFQTRNDAKPDDKCCTITRQVVSRRSTFERGFSRASNFHDTFCTGESPLPVHHARCVRDSLESTLETLRKIVRRRKNNCKMIILGYVFWWNDISRMEKLQRVSRKYTCGIFVTKLSIER